MMRPRAVAATRAAFLALIFCAISPPWSSAGLAPPDSVARVEAPPITPVSSSIDPVFGFTYHPSLTRQLAGSAAVMGAGFALDDAIPPGDEQGTTFDDVGRFLGSPYTLLGGTLLYGLHGVITNDHGERTAAKKVTFALGATYATVAILKLSISEDRPDGSDDDSFPSGHAAGAFAVATALDRQYGGATGWIAYGAATFVATSRVNGMHHRFEDVVAGAVIGHFYGWLFTR